MTVEVPPPLVALQDKLGMLFYAPHEIASLTLERPARCRVVCKDGTVAFRPDVPAGDWTRLDASFVNSTWLQPDDQGVWRDPGSFAYSGAASGPGLEPPASQPIAALNTTAEQVLALKVLPDDLCIWVTERGDISQSVPAETACSLHPHLLQVRRSLWINRRRLRRLQPDGSSYLVVMDNAEVLGRVGNAWKGRVAEQLEIPYLGGWDPPVPGLSPYYLRDWPVELALASKEQLRLWFSSAEELIANITYQAVRYRELGDPRQHYGDTHEGFMYKPLHSPLVRAEFLTVSRATKEQLSQKFQQICNALVGQARLFTYHELGFRDARPWMRRIGSQRPEVLLLVEKDSMREHAETVADALGISYFVSGGLPRLVSTEHLVEALSKFAVGDLIVVALVDFDNKGWSIATGFVLQLSRYGRTTTGPVHYVVLGELFSDEEVELFSYPLNPKDPSGIGQLRKWMERSGGLRGQPRGIHCNHFVPVERILERVRQILEDKKVP